MNHRFRHFLAKPRTLWVTGASSGIGRELALQLAQAGHRVVISARSVTALQQMAAQYPEQLQVLDFDATDDAACTAAAGRLASLAPTLDIAILNAGTCEYLNDGDINLALVRRVMAANFDGTVRAATLALPLLTRSASPALYVVSSQVTSVALTRSGAYGASKAALEYFFRCLRIDRYGSGLRIGIVRPGFVRTALTDRNDFAMPFLWEADRAAARILQGIDGGREEINFPWPLDWLLRLCACLPHSRWAHIAQRMRKPAAGVSP